MKRLRARNQKGSLVETASGEYQANWNEYVVNPVTGKSARKHRTKILGRIGNGKHETLRKVDAERELAKIVAPLNAQTFAKQDGRTDFSWFLDKKFLPLRKAGWGGPASRSSGREIELYIRPAFGHLPLEDIDLTMLQMFSNRLAAEGYSWSVVSKTRIMVKSILEYACELGFIPRNPAHSKNYRMPICKPTKKPVISLSSLMALWSKIEDPRDRLIIVVGSCCALRSSELFGLVWECVHPTHLHIRSTAYEGKLYEYRVKRKASFRLVPLNKNIYRYFQRLKAMAEHTEPGDLVFPNDTGSGPMWPGIFLQKRIQPLARELGIKVPITFQVLRRSFITENQDHVKATQGVAGHSSALMTLDGYAQPITEKQEQLVDSYYWKIMNAAKPTRRVQ